MRVSPMSLHQLVQKIKSRQVTVAEVVQDTLYRIQHHADLGAFIHVNDSALDAARLLDERLANQTEVGPLCGAPIAIKDLIVTKDQPTTFGGKHTFSQLGHSDANVVATLRQSDGILIGKTNLHEYAFGTTGINLHFGAARNPWDTDRMAGGSSSGSAVAVAAGLCAGAIGTDTGGSIRIPSALTGFVGFKPTYGALPLDGTLALAPSLDHLGPMAATVEDIRLLYSALKNPTSVDGSHHDSQGQAGFSHPSRSSIVLGVPRNFFWDIGQEPVFNAVKEAIEVLTRHDRALPRFKSTEITMPLMDEVPTAQSILLFTEAAAIHLEHYQTEPEHFGVDVAARLSQAIAYRGYEYVQSKEIQTRFKQSLHEVFNQVDVIVTPTVPIEAPLLSDTTLRLNESDYAVPAILNRCTNPWNLAGCPAITIPCGVTANGLPVGLQLIAAWGRDWALLDAALHAEAVLAPTLSTRPAKHK